MSTVKSDFASAFFLRAPRWAAPEQARSLPSGEWTVYSPAAGLS